MYENFFIISQTCVRLHLGYIIQIECTFVTSCGSWKRRKTEKILTSFQRNRTTRDRFRTSCMHTIPFVLLSSSTATLIREDGGRKKADSRADIRKSQVFATLFTQGLCTMPSYRSQTRKTSQLTTQREPSRSSLSFVTTLSSLIRPLLLGIVRWSVLISLVKRRDYIRDSTGKWCNSSWPLDKIPSDRAP